MFVGREKELDHLEKQYSGDGFQFTVIYGRRRIGKTRLIQEYIRNKNAIYYMAIQAGEKRNLEEMSYVVNRHQGRSDFSPLYRGYRQIFSDIAYIAKKQRLIFIIDEYPYLAESEPEISSILQYFCDHEWKDTQLHLILCGSSMSFMERQVLGAKSPLYGRRTSQIRLSPFRFCETEAFFGSLSREDKAVYHAVTGGVAEYLTFIDPGKSRKENLVSLFLDPQGRLIDEPGNLLLQELREPRTYNKILDAIAAGATKHNEIATKAQISSGSLSNYLESLMELGIVIRETPFGSPVSRKTIYRIQDGCFRFWHRYVGKHRSAIELGAGGRVYDRFVETDLNNFMGYGFEQIAYDIFDRLNIEGRLPDLFTQRGRWWGNNSLRKREEEIDLVGQSAVFTIFGEMKWTKEKLSIHTLEDLIEKSHCVLHQTPSVYILFSKNGFTEEVVEAAKKSGDLLLYDFQSGLMIDTTA